MKCAQRRPTDTIHGSEICDPSMNKRAVLRSRSVCKQFAKSVKAAHPAGGGDSPPHGRLHFVCQPAATLVVHGTHSMHSRYIGYMLH